MEDLVYEITVRQLWPVSPQTIGDPENAPYREGSYSIVPYSKPDFEWNGWTSNG